MNSQFSQDTIRAGVAAYWTRNNWPGREKHDTLESLTRYALAVDSAPQAEIGPWLTVRCPECEKDTKDMSTVELSDHMCLVGYVLIGCEGYWVVNPNAVGIAVPEWDDWTHYGDPR